MKIDEILFYFDFINRNKADCVLDIGMFIEQFRGIARQTANRELPEALLLDGIELGEMTFPIYKKIYDHIFSKGERSEKYYDLVLALNLEDRCSKEELQDWLLYAIDHGRYVALTKSVEDKKMQASQMELNYTQGVYYVVDSLDYHKNRIVDLMEQKKYEEALQVVEKENESEDLEICLFGAYLSDILKQGEAAWTYINRAREADTDGGKTAVLYERIRKNYGY